MVFCLIGLTRRMSGLRCVGGLIATVEHRVAAGSDGIDETWGSHNTFT
jgi:hypothetical protein